MLRKKTVFVDCSEDISLTDDITFLEAERLELPKFLGVERWDINTLGHKDGLRNVSDNLQGTLNTVENFIKDSRSEFNREGLFGSLDGISDSKSGWVSEQLHVSS